MVALPCSARPLFILDGSAIHAVLRTPEET